MESPSETKPAVVEAVQTFEGSKSGTMYTVPAADVTMTTKSVKPKSLKCVCIDDIVQFEKDEYKRYNCGGCRHKFITVCLLHEHLKLHGSGGSYHFDHVSNTAFPKYDTFCSFTQTDGNFFDERAEAPLASVSDQESNDELEDVDQEVSDHEDSNEPVDSLYDQEDNVSASTDQEVDSYTKTKTVASVNGGKVKIHNKTPIKIAKVVLEDINDLITGKAKKGMKCKVVTLNGTINGVSIKDILESRHPRTLRSGKLGHAEMDQQPSVIVGPKLKRGRPRKLPVNVSKAADLHYENDANDVHLTDNKMHNVKPEITNNTKPNKTLKIKKMTKSTNIAKHNESKNTTDGADISEKDNKLQSNASLVPKPIDIRSTPIEGVPSYGHVRIERRGRKKGQKLAQIRKIVDEDPDYNIESDIDICEKDEILQDIAPASRTLRNMSTLRKRNTAGIQPNDKSRGKKHKGYLRETPANIEKDSDCEIYMDFSSDMEDNKQDLLQESSVKKPTGALRSRGSGTDTCKKELGDVIDIGNELLKVEPFAKNIDNLSKGINPENRRLHDDKALTDGIEIKVECEEVLLSSKNGNKVHEDNDTNGESDIEDLTDGEDDQKHRKKSAKVCKEKPRNRKGSKTTKPGLKKGQRQICEICNKSMRKGDLKRHMRYHEAKKAKIEAANRLHTCEICKKMVVKKMLKKHMYYRHEVKKDVVMCEVCGKPYNRFSIKQHMQSHLEKMPYPCTLCSKQFYVKTCLDVHMARHQRTKAHGCNVCDMRFYTKRNLLKHQEVVHMGLKRLQCDLCERSFARKVNLDSHRMTHFEPSIPCRFCPKMFRLTTARNRHELIHTGIKKYQCHICCDHGFIQSTPYYVHMEKHHGFDRATVKKILGSIYNLENKMEYNSIKLPMMMPRGTDSSVISQLAGENNGHAASTVDESAIGTSDVTSIVKVEHIVAQNSNSIAIGHKPNSTIITKSGGESTMPFSFTSNSRSVSTREPRQTAFGDKSLTPHQQESNAAVQALQAAQNPAVAPYTFLPNMNQSETYFQ